jgi:hypothetical protein
MKDALLVGFVVCVLLSGLPPIALATVAFFAVVLAIVYWR